MDNFMIPFIILLVAMLVSRVVQEKANRKLDQDKKATLIDLFASGRIWTYGVLIAIIVFFFVGLRYRLMDLFLLNIIYLSALGIYILAYGYYSYRKLKGAGFPDFYIRSYIISTSLRVTGLVVFVLLLEF